MTGSPNGSRIEIDGNKGFTLVELMIVIAITAILVAISVPNVMRYRSQAEFAALKADMNVLMNAEDAYYTAEGTYFPQNGTIDIPSGTELNIPQLGFTFKKGHKHRFYLYGFNMDFGSIKYNYYCIIVYADEDYNRNGSSDILYYITYVYNDQMIYHRQFNQLL
jgi:prepilin-type N-terminal cleavage/methylation domain-containing protein